MLELKFNILDKVEIIPLNNKEGTVISMWITEKEAQYKIRYFTGDEPKEIYYYDWELKNSEEKKNERKIGFKQ
jgi:hypothetical protein